MKKYFFAFLSAFIAFTASAQVLSSGYYSATIGDLETRSYTTEFSGKSYDFTEYKGNCSFTKKGYQTVYRKFSVLQNGLIISVNIEEEIRGGTSIMYNIETKKFSLAGEDYKPKNKKNIKNIILSAILIYAKWSIK